LENKGIVAELWRRVTVDSEAALREALTAQQDGDVIWLDANNIPGKTITLSSALPNFTKKVIIEGNGIALAQGSAGFQGLYVMDNNAKVAVRGVHFKDWQAVAMSPGSFNNGGAIFQNAGKLALESCVFSGNKGGTSGTIYVSGGANTSLTVLGSAFVNNTGSEILVYYAGTLQLGGNLFYGNTSRYVQGVGVSGGSGIITITSLGYNVSDKPSGTGTTQSGFAFAAGDKTVNDAVAFSPVNFKPSLGSPLLNTVDIAAFNSANPERPYPQQDFYGDPIATTGTAAAGAVQEVGGYLLAVTTDGSGQVTGATPDAGGFIAPGVSFTLLAIPTGDNSLRSFSINGQEQNSHTYSVTSMNENLTVRAVFRKSVTVSNETEFLAALADPECDGVILLPADGVITLNARASIAKNFVIEGNGAVITRSSAFPSSSTTSQLIYIYGAGVTVRIRQVHFRDGQAQGGSAIYNRSSTITLESCVFSGNKETSDSWGGAVYIYGGGATILGCTFYANVGNYGGAVCINSGTLNLGGNLFYGNTARDDRVVFSNGTITSLGYNVSDKPGGTGTTQSGFVFAAGDKQLTNPTTDPLDPSDATHPYKPAAASLSDITIVDTSAIPGYPEKDFYGASRSGTVPAGAVANY
jgi:hypothetical protein